MEFDFNGLTNDMVHASGFGGEDVGVLELDLMAQAQPCLIYLDDPDGCDGDAP
jgi:hypothetical protein